MPKMTARQYGLARVSWICRGIQVDLLPGNIDRAMCEVVFKGPEVLTTETICLLEPFVPFTQDGLRSFTVERNHPLEHWSDHALD